MFKSGGSGKAKQYSVHCCLRNYVELVLFVFGSLFIAGYVSLAEQSCYPYHIAKILHLDDNAKINY